MNLFTQIFKELFEETGLTKRQFSIKTNIKHSQIPKYLEGKIPSIESAVKICAFFGCSLDYLCGQNDNFSYTNSKTGFDKSAFYPEYAKLLKQNNISHFALARQGIVCETRLSYWKTGGCPSFETLINIATFLGGSIDKMLGKI